MLEKNKESNLTIACDIDDTIAYLVPAWVKWLNKKHNSNVSYDDIVDWDITKAFPFLSPEQIFEPLYIEDFWKSVIVIYDAIFYIRKLIDEGFDFYLVTSSHPKSMFYKYCHIISSHFDFIDSRNIIACHNKQLIRCDILIDDAIHNIIGPYEGILFTTPWNFEFAERKYGVHRADNWKQVYDKIHEIAEIKEKRSLI